MNFLVLIPSTPGVIGLVKKITVKPDIWVTVLVPKQSVSEYGTLISPSSEFHTCPFSLDITTTDINQTPALAMACERFLLGDFEKFLILRETDCKNDLFRNVTVMSREDVKNLYESIGDH